MNGILRVGGMRADRATHREYTDLAEVLEQEAGTDVIITATHDAELTILDCDSHHLTEKPTTDALIAHLAAIEPQPDACWTSHGAGLKLVYVGPHHREKAIAAALKVPTFLTVELLTQTRHPRSRSKKPGHGECGPVVYATSDGDARPSWERIGQLRADQRELALRKLDVEDGGRYDHDRCPLDPGAPTAATGCVVVLAGGVYCHRCAGHGISYSPRTKAGFYPFSAVVEAPTTDIASAARERVHWAHARLQLRHYYPNLSEPILQHAYRYVLESMWGADDPRIRMAFNRDLDVVWSDAGWLDATTLRPTEVDNDIASELPYTQNLVPTKDSGTRCVVDKARRSQVRNRSPRGYEPIVRVRGLQLFPVAGTIPVPVPPAPRFPFEILTDPLPMATALEALHAPFPQFDPVYLQAAIGAFICATAGTAQTPMIVATGPSGSGKEQHIRLAASFVGHTPVKLPLTSDEAEAARSLGTAVADGNGFIVLDEIGKTRDLVGLMKPIFAINGLVQWRPLYQNRLVATPLKAAIFFPTVRLPPYLAESAEFDRRVRSVRLYHTLPNWARTCGGDCIGWRDRVMEHALVANSIVTHVYRLCRDHAFRFLDGVADALGLRSITDGEQGISDAALKALYRHARNEDGRRVLLQDATFRRGWVDLRSPAAMQIMNMIASEDDFDDPKTARRIIGGNLEAVSWNSRLGISSPRIAIEIRMRGNKWGMRFISGEPAMKGREQINEQLPPIPQQDQAACGNPPPPPASSTAVEASSAPTPTAAIQPPDLNDPDGDADNAADAALRSAGFPT